MLSKEDQGETGVSHVVWTRTQFSLFFPYYGNCYGIWGNYVGYSVNRILL